MTIAAPERDLLTACAVWNAGATELARIREATCAVSGWEHWLCLARMHRLVPHARRALIDSGATVPAHVARALETESRAIAAGALARAHQLADLLRALHAAGVRALPFKGPALSLAAYGDLGVRDSIDLDVVVPARHLARAREALREAGYAPRSGMSPAQERVLQRSFGHYSYARAGEPAPVELHWRFAAPRYPWSMPVEEVLARAGTGALAGVPVATAEATDEVLLQAMHGTRHQWERLEWLVTFRQLMRIPGVDQDALVERARTNGSVRALAVGLRLAGDVLGAPVAPLLPGLAAIAADRSVTALAHEIAAALDRAMRSSESPTDQPYAFNLRMMERAGDRARYLALSVFAPTPREWELVRLSGWALPLYYPLRVARVIALRTVRLARAIARR